METCSSLISGGSLTNFPEDNVEDYVNTLLTKDKNKLRVYTDGFDGHSMRARAFFAKDLMHIDPNDVKAVNSIKTDYADFRDKAKSPHFLLQYGGSYRGLQINCGFTEEEAKEMEYNYHQLYKESDAWTQEKLVKASNDGYVTLAFGVRLRTPILQKTVLGSKFTPAQAAAESRSAGNAVSGQSYGLLNSRAGVEFHRRVLNSPYKLDIHPIAEIHDALYYVISDRIEVVEWVNKNLIDCMRWQELPELQHETIKLNSELDICYPTWANPITIPNNATGREIVSICAAAMANRVK